MNKLSALLGKTIKSILLVDDDDDLIEVMSDHLRNEGFEVISASSGEEATEKILNENFDLIVLDIYMPKGNGLEILRDLGQETESRFILMSAVDDFAEMSVNLGASMFLSKPFSPEFLAGIVKTELKESLAS